MFLLINHPLSLGFLLITQTLLISLFSGTITIIFWFSYSLFLIFIGGILILFIYITSLASNEIFKFSINSKKIFYFLILISIILFLFIFIDTKNFLLNNNIINNENLSLFKVNTILEKNNLLLSIIYNFPTNIITIILVNYLFLTLIATVKITNIFKGPLRQKII